MLGLIGCKDVLALQHKLRRLQVNVDVNQALRVQDDCLSLDQSDVDFVMNGVVIIAIVTIFCLAARL